MCVVSMIGDHYSDKWKNPNSPFQPYTIPSTTASPYTGVGQEEFNALKKEVEEMKQLLIKAKIYDEKNNEPHCEMEDKVELLKKVAKLFGVDLKEVFGDESK